MQELHEKGVANHLDPESRAGTPRIGYAVLRIASADWKTLPSNCRFQT